VENDKELFMNNQNSGSGGASPELQPASNDTGGQATPVVALTSPSVPAGASSPSGTSGTIVPDGEKGGHD
jgi:hypothetical protein